MPCARRTRSRNKSLASDRSHAWNLQHADSDLLSMLARFLDHDVSSQVACFSILISFHDLIRFMVMTLHQFHKCSSCSLTSHHFHYIYSIKMSFRDMLNTLFHITSCFMTFNFHHHCSHHLSSFRHVTSRLFPGREVFCRSFCLLNGGGGCACPTPPLL